MTKYKFEFWSHWGIIRLTKVRGGNSMAFVDKLGMMANKVGEVAGETLDYSKAKGKEVLERGKVKDAKEALGDYVYKTLVSGDNLDMGIVTELCDEVDIHVKNVEQYQREAKKSDDDI